MSSIERMVDFVNTRAFLNLGISVPSILTSPEIIIVIIVIIICYHPYARYLQLRS